MWPLPLLRTPNFGCHAGPSPPAPSPASPVNFAAGSKSASPAATAEPVRTHTHNETATKRLIGHALLIGTPTRDGTGAGALSGKRLSRNRPTPRDRNSPAILSPPFPPPGRLSPAFVPTPSPGDRTMNRRQFLQAGAAAGLALSAAGTYAADVADRKPRVALIGCGWYGKIDLLRLIQVAPVEVVSLCDVDKKMLAEAADIVAGRQASKKKPRTFADYRDLLKEKDL